MTRGELQERTREVVPGEDNIKFQLATHMDIAVAEDGYFITFARANPPPGWDKDAAETPVDAVAKVFLGRGSMQYFARMIEVVLERTSNE